MWIRRGLARTAGVMVTTAAMVVAAFATQAHTCRPASAGHMQ